MSRTLRKTRDLEIVPEGIHRKKNYRCRCSWCLCEARRKFIERQAKKEIKNFEK